MAITVGGVAIDLSANAAQVVGEMERASRATLRASQQMQGGLGRWGGAFRRTETLIAGFAGRTGRLLAGVAKSFALGLGGGALLGGGGLIYGAKRAIEAADALAKAADRAGVTTDAYQELAFQASQTGVNQDKLNTSLQAFGRRVAEARAGTGPLASTLRKLNPELFESLKATTSQEQALRVMANAIKGARDQSEALALAQAAFSEAGRALTLTFRDGAESIDYYAQRAREFGLVISEDLLRSAEDANDQLDLLGRVIQAQFVGAMLQAAPAISRLAEALAEMIPNLVETVASWAEWVGLIERTNAQVVASQVATINVEMAALLKTINDLSAAEGDFQDEIQIGAAQFAALAQQRQEALDYLAASTETAAKNSGELGEALAEPWDEAAWAADQYHDAIMRNLELQKSAAFSTPPPGGYGGPRMGPGATEQAPSTAADAARQTDEAAAANERLARQIEDANTAADDQAESLQALTAAASSTAGALAGIAGAQQSLNSGNMVAFVGQMISSLATLYISATQAAAALVAARTAGYDYSAAPTVIAAAGAVIAAIGVLGASIQARATGGPVMAGQPYLVGERGAEMFVPSRGGQIISNAELRGGTAGGSSGSVTVLFRGEGADMAAAVRDPQNRRLLASAIAIEMRGNPDLRRTATRRR